MSQAENIRNGLVTNLQPLLAANGGPVGQILPYAVANMSPPVIYVSAGDIDYDVAMTKDLHSFLVTALVAETEIETAQRTIDSLRDNTGSLSVKALIETDRTLGGACSACSVDKVSRSQLYDVPNAPGRVGCEWTVNVYT